MAPSWFRTVSTDYPPLYPATLAVTAFATGASTLTASRWIDVVTFTMSAGLVALAAQRIARGSRAAGVVAALIFVASASVLDIHAHAWSEGLFLSLTLGSLLLLARFLEGGRMAIGVAAACLAGAAPMTRYVGIAVVITVVVAALRWRPEPRGRRLRRGGVLTGVALAPALVLLYRRNAIEAERVLAAAAFCVVFAGTFWFAQRLL